MSSVLPIPVCCGDGCDARATMRSRPVFEWMPIGRWCVRCAPADAEPIPGMTPSVGRMRKMPSGVLLSDDGVRTRARRMR